MEFATVMQALPQNENAFRLRQGQQALAEYLPDIKEHDRLSIQWPTGYGKSIGFAMAWKHCVDSGLANRFLLVVSNDTQRHQIKNDFAQDCERIAAPCRGGVWSFQRSGSDLRAAMTRASEVFVCTVQQLEASNHGGTNTLKDLLTCPRTRWMIGFDEFHHYGEDMAWANAAEMAMEYAAFTLAMSATPYRRRADVIFPEPKQTVSYSKAVKEHAVKPMICHSYDYKVTVVNSEERGETSYTTSELMAEAPQGIDKWEERRNIRYSPQYLHPLIIHPLDRLTQKRAATGQKLQMLVRAMSCSHAEMLCKQVRSFADYLTVDWIGTGPRGRSQEANERIRLDFCPAKIGGVRPPPKLDILVQVSMAGEGFDSINVAEIVDIFPVSKLAANGRATQDKQFYGRGSRVIPNAPNVHLHVNVPSDHPLHQWAGMEIHRWMDSSGDEEVTPRSSDSAPPEPDLFYFPDLPSRREIELLNITTENPHFRHFAGRAAKERPIDFEKDKEWLLEIYRSTARVQADRDGEQARLSQTRDTLNGIVGRIGRVLAEQTGEATTTKLIGRQITEVNIQIKRKFGKARDEMLTEEMEEAFNWCQKYLKSLKVQ